MGPGIQYLTPSISRFYYYRYTSVAFSSISNGYEVVKGELLTIFNKQTS